MEELAIVKLEQAWLCFNIIIIVTCTLLQKRILDEIKRRLGILSKHWEEGRLSRPVQVEMTKLASGV